MALIAIVAVALGGRLSSSRAVPAPVAAASPSAVAVAGASPEATLSPAATPSPRSDWPAAIGPHRPPPAGTRREEGTDGLMGRLPFGLPDDTPLVRVEPVNRFTIDDVLVGWSGYDSTPPWVRRPGGLGGNVTDPDER
jgi:hypothetical protein